MFRGPGEAEGGEPGAGPRATLAVGLSSREGAAQHFPLGSPASGLAGGEGIGHMCLVTSRKQREPGGIRSDWLASPLNLGFLTHVGGLDWPAFEFPSSFAGWLFHSCFIKIPKELKDKTVATAFLKKTQHLALVKRIFRKHTALWVRSHLVSKDTVGPGFHSSCVNLCSCDWCPHQSVC